MLELLLRVQGGGKRGRDLNVDLGKDEKALMVRAQLTKSIEKVRVPTVTNVMLLETRERVLQGFQVLTSEGNENYMVDKIATMKEPGLLAIKEFYTSNMLTEGTNSRLARLFLEELSELDEASELFHALADAGARTFELLLVSFIYDAGKFRYKELRDRVERRLDILTILREHGQDPL